MMDKTQKMVHEINTEDEYISIKEFSKRANVSVQSIYKRLNGLNNPLNQYIKQVESQKMLNIRALSDIYGVEVEQPIQPNHSTYSTLDSTSDSIKLLEKTIEILEKELEEKKKQNEFLQTEVIRLNSELLRLSNKVGDTLQTITQTQLADRMIEGKKLIDEPEKNKSFWQKLFTK